MNTSRSKKILRFKLLVSLPNNFEICFVIILKMVFFEPVFEILFSISNRTRRYVLIPFILVKKGETL